MALMKIATWNVNSIRARLPVVLQWLELENPDILLLQELKCEESAFPYEELQRLHYNLAIYGQKTYNGVAILSKFPLEDIQRNFPNGNEQEARYIEAVASTPLGPFRIASIYVINGQEVDSPAYAKKLEFLDHLTSHLKTLLSYEEKVVIGGDYNIAPDHKDVWDPKAWEGQVLCTIPERKAFREMINLGFYDAYRALHPDKVEFSWWDYRGRSLERNAGLRIDHCLLSPEAMESLKETYIDKKPREWEKTSDHTPIVLEF